MPDSYVLEICFKKLQGIFKNNETVKEKHSQGC